MRKEHLPIQRLACYIIGGQIDCIYPFEKENLKLL